MIFFVAYLFLNTPRSPQPRGLTKIRFALGGGRAGKLLRFKVTDKTRLNYQPLRIRISEFEIRWLTEKAKFVRVAMKNVLSKRRGDRPSRPGEPPTRRLGFIRKMVFYSVDRREVTAVIGPLLRRKNTQKICGILDRGGTERIRPPGFRFGFLVRYAPRPFSRRGLVIGLRQYNDKRMEGRL